jgi:RNA methyltransferase, TrmH family
VLTRREEKLLRALAHRRTREAEGCFVAEGIRLVEDLLSSPIPVRLLVVSSSLEDTDRGAALLADAARRGLRTESVPPNVLARIADTQTPQGVVAIAGLPTAVLDAISTADHGRTAVLVLDAVQDPGNFGTLVRTAEALGASAVLLLPGTVDPWNPKAVRAAMGASFRLPLVSTTWREAAPWLRRRRFEIIAAASDGDPGIAARPSNFALVVGNEGSGISRETREAADRVVAIPLRGRAESLNVGGGVVGFFCGFLS